MKLKSRHSIFKKGNIMLRLLKDTLISDVSKIRYPDSTNIMESYR